MPRKKSRLMLPFLNTKVIKTETIKTIESMLREGLGTIIEEDEPTPTPTPRPQTAISPVPLSGRSLERKISLQKRTVSAKLRKRPSHKGGGWQLKISKFSTVFSAPISSLGNSYVRMMNGLMARGNLGELAMYNGSADIFLPFEKSDSFRRYVKIR